MSAGAPERRAFLYRHAQRSGCDAAACAVYAVVATARGPLSRSALLTASGETDDTREARARLSAAIVDLISRRLLTRSLDRGAMRLRALTPTPSPRRVRHVSETDTIRAHRPTEREG